MVFSRGLLISLAVTAITSILLFMYIRNRFSKVEHKVNTMFQLIQEHSTQNQIQREMNNPQTDITITEKQPQQNASQLIPVSDTEASDSEPDTDSESVMTYDSISTDSMSINTEDDNEEIVSQTLKIDSSIDSHDLEELEVEELPITHNTLDDVETNTNNNVSTVEIEELTTDNVDDIEVDTIVDDDIESIVLDDDIVSDVEELTNDTKTINISNNDADITTTPLETNNEAEPDTVSNTLEHNLMKQEVINTIFVDYKKMPVKMLRKIALEKGLTEEKNKLKKKELIELLNNS